MCGVSQLCARPKMPTDVSCERKWMCWFLRIACSRKVTKRLLMAIPIGRRNLNWISIVEEVMTQHDRKELRNFGVLVGAVFGLIGIWPALFRGESPRIWALAISGTLIVLGI